MMVKRLNMPDGHILEIQQESIEVTRGIHGAPLEPTRRFAAGPVSYYLDGEPISAEQAQQIIADADAGQSTA